MHAPPPPPGAVNRAGDWGGDTVRRPPRCRLGANALPCVGGAWKPHPARASGVAARRWRPCAVRLGGREPPRDVAPTADAGAGAPPPPLLAVGGGAARAVAPGGSPAPRPRGASGGRPHRGRVAWPPRLPQGVGRRRSSGPHPGGRGSRRRCRRCAERPRTRCARGGDGGGGSTGGGASVRGRPLRSGAPAWVAAAATVAHRRRRCRHLCHRRRRMAGGSRRRHEWRPPAGRVWPATSPSSVSLCVANTAVGVHRCGGALACSPGGHGGGGGVDGGGAWWEQACRRCCRRGPARPLAWLTQRIGYGGDGGGGGGASILHSPQRRPRRLPRLPPLRGRRSGASASP